MDFQSNLATLQMGLGSHCHDSHCISHSHNSYHKTSSQQRTIGSFLWIHCYASSTVSVIWEWDKSDESLCHVRSFLIYQSLQSNPQNCGKNLLVPYVTLATILERLNKTILGLTFSSNSCDLTLHHLIVWDYITGMTISSGTNYPNHTKVPFH